MQMNESKFSQDIKSEAWFSSILDKDFYPKFIEKLNINSPDNEYSIKRINDMESQYKGIDLIISNSKTSMEYLIDEKSQLNYLNKTLPTFTFELEFSKYGIRKEGWFLDSRKKTTYYFFFRHIFGLKGAHVDSFHMDSINIKRFKDYLSRFKLNDDFLKNIIVKLNQSNNIDDDLFLRKVNRYGFKVLPEYLNSIITLSISPQLNEKPINLLVNLDKLKEIEPNLFKQYKYPFLS